MITITIDMPLWLAIVCLVIFILLFIYCLLSDFFIKLIHKKYDLDLKDKNETKSNHDDSCNEKEKE